MLTRNFRSADANARLVCNEVFGDGTSTGEDWNTPSICLVFFEPCRRIGQTACLVGAGPPGEAQKKEKM